MKMSLGVVFFINNSKKAWQSASTITRLAFLPFLAIYFVCVNRYTTATFWRHEFRGYSDLVCSSYTLELHFYDWNIISVTRIFVSNQKNSRSELLSWFLKVIFQQRFEGVSFMDTVTLSEANVQWNFIFMLGISSLSLG